MKIVRVPWLKSVDKYITKAASSDAQRTEIKAHIKKIIESTEVGSEVLVVIAKSLAPAIAHMLYENLDAHCVVVKSSHEIELMREFDALGRKVHILTHGRGVGDNAYRTQCFDWAIRWIVCSLSFLSENRLNASFNATTANDPFT